MPRKSRVEVLLFARASELAGADRLTIELEEDSPRLEDVIDAIVERVPGLQAFLPYCRYAVNKEFAELQSPIPPDAEVAVIPPVSGGLSPESVPPANCHEPHRP